MGRVGIPLIGLAPPHCFACSMSGPEFPVSHVVFFLCSGSSVKMRGDCSFCWYWWNWWTSLLKLSFHNILKYYSEIRERLTKRDKNFDCSQSVFPYYNLTTFHRYDAPYLPPLDAPNSSVSLRHEHIYQYLEYTNTDGFNLRHNYATINLAVLAFDFLSLMSGFICSIYN